MCSQRTHLHSLHMWNLFQHSVLGTARRRITAFSPSSAAPVPPAITMDTDSGATQFVFKTLYDDEGNEFTVRTPVRDQTAIPMVVDPEEVPQSPTFLTAGTRQRATAVPTNSRDASCSQSQVSRGRSQTRRSSRASGRGDKDPFAEQSGDNPNPNDGNGGGEDPDRTDPSGDRPTGGPSGGPPAGGAAGLVPTEPTPQQLLALFQNFTGSLDTLGQVLGNMRGDTGDAGKNKVRSRLFLRTLERGNFILSWYCIT
ncbi:hypothetical protein BT96DRAFT_999164 [Gymnopus androsaceus JB14]|uniref:Uncharacterized protein n=1 Tax=Gymnopus androsaceus JB14 TaxID=1447944 RepID=A0A6A4H697_9AGAR|nr:hypothetical protein BT96DRAFT_999164 [Gymnopus androsaceus JB14]